MTKDPDPRQEGHTREWADRARVELNPREDVQKPASPNQSPIEPPVEEKAAKEREETEDDDAGDPVY